MDAFTTRLSALLREQLNAEMRKTSDGMALAPASSFESYREAVGVVKGLKRAEAILGQLEAELSRAEEASDGKNLPIYQNRRYED